MLKYPGTFKIICTLDSMRTRHLIKFLVVIHDLFSSTLLNLKIVFKMCYFAFNGIKPVSSSKVLVSEIIKTSFLMNMQLKRFFRKKFISSFR